MNTQGARNDLSSKSDINVVNFAQERLKELTLLENDLNKGSNGKRVFQNMPRHLRRRSMSYDLKRIPKRLQPVAVQEMKDTNPPKKVHRKFKRRPKHIRENYGNRQNDKLWLETHIWHAKRMHMINIYGYRLARTPTDKSSRAVYKATANIATMHDLSFMQCVRLLGKQKDIIALLNSFMLPNTNPFELKETLKGEREGATTLYKPSTRPPQLIAPISFLWRSCNQVDNQKEGPSSREIWIWIHPAAKSDFMESLASFDKEFSVDVRDLSNMVVRFRLAGPRANLIMHSSINPVQNGSCAVQTWEQIAKLRSTSSLPIRSVISLNIQDCRWHFPPMSAKKSLREGDITSFDLGDDLTNTLLNWPPELADSALWDYILRIADSKQEEKIRTDQELTAAKQMAEKMEIDQIFSPNGNNNKSDKNSMPQELPIMIIQQKPNITNVEFGNAIDILLPKGWAMSLWRSLSYAGAWAIGREIAKFNSLEKGLDEARAMATEQMVPHYPEDFPFCAAGRLYQSMRQSSHILAYEKKPPSKRVNYLRINMPYPFSTPWHMLFWKDKDILTSEEAEDRKRDRSHMVESTEASGRYASLNAHSKQEKQRCISEIEKKLWIVTGSEMIREAFSQVLTSGRASLEDPLYFGFVRVSIEMGHRGTPWEMARICIPPSSQSANEIVEDEVEGYSDKDNDDAEKAVDIRTDVEDLAKGMPKTMTKKREKKLSQIKREKAQKFNEDSDGVEKNSNRKAAVRPKFSDVIENYSNSLPPWKYDVIGYVTAGGHSLRKGKGMALGLCSIRSIRAANLSANDFTKTGSISVLIRNVDSRLYDKARMRILEE